MAKASTYTQITSSNWKSYLEDAVGTHTKQMVVMGLPYLQAFRGLYDSKETAHKTVIAGLDLSADTNTISGSTACTKIPRGFTVEVIENGKIATYQYQKEMPTGGYTMTDLVKKSDAYATGSSTDYFVTESGTYESLEALLADTSVIISAGEYIKVADAIYQSEDEHTIGTDITDEDSFNGYFTAVTVFTEDEKTILSIYKDVIFYCTDSDGDYANKILLNGQQYGGDDLNPATAETLGGVMVGDGIDVDDSGVISVPLAQAPAEGIDGNDGLMSKKDKTVFDTSCAEAKAQADRVKMLAGFEEIEWENYFAEESSRVVYEGDYIIRENILYVCITEHVGSTWNAADFEATSFAKLFTDWAENNENEQVSLYVFAHSYSTASGVKTLVKDTLASLVVSVTDTTTSEDIIDEVTTSVASNGKCDIEINVPKGHTYTITVTNPDSTKYEDLAVTEFLAKNNERTVEFNFNPIGTKKETVVVQINAYNNALNQLTGTSFPSVLQDLEVYISIDGGTANLMPAVDGTNNRYSVEVPYGSTYEITPPVVSSESGYSCMFRSVRSHTANTAIRTIYIDYSASIQNGVYVLLVDEDNVIEKVDYNELVSGTLTDEQINRIKYIYFATSELRRRIYPTSGNTVVPTYFDEATEEQKAACEGVSGLDDGQDNYFAIAVEGAALSGLAWGTGEAASNTVDTVALPKLTAVTQYTNTSLFTGYKNTDAILDQGWEGAATTPAATACNNLKLTFKLKADGDEYEAPGFLPAFGQLYAIANSQSGTASSNAQIKNYGQLWSAYEAIFNVLYAKRGISQYTLRSGYWWSSCQNSETNAVGLNSGGFGVSNYKSNNYTTLVCYDLQI